MFETWNFGFELSNGAWIFLAGKIKEGGGRKEKNGAKDSGWFLFVVKTSAKKNQLSIRFAECWGGVLTRKEMNRGATFGSLSSLLKSSNQSLITYLLYLAKLAMAHGQQTHYRLRHPHLHTLHSRSLCIK